MPTPAIERRLLQIAVAVAGLVPVGGGLAGMLLGSAAIGSGADVSVDSHVRYLSGLLFGLGIAFWAAIPRVEAHATRFALLGSLVVVGGLARLGGVLAVGAPSAPMVFGLVMECVVTPLIVLWQRRVARQSAPSSSTRVAE